MPGPLLLQTVGFFFKAVFDIQVVGSILLPLNEKD